MSETLSDDRRRTAMIRRAEGVVADLAPRFPAILAEEVAAARGALPGLRSRDPEVAAAARERLRALAAEVKGQGGSFAHPLATVLGASLERLTRFGNPATEADRQLIDDHLAALEEVARRDLASPDTPEARHLLGRLFGAKCRLLAEALGRTGISAALLDHEGVWPETGSLCAGHCDACREG